MSKNPPPVIKPTNPAAKPVVTKAAPSTNRTIRETVESVIIAFVLAFLFRTFEAEAFVIPTGSMAPTLQGRHKDLECPQCGFPYRVSASSEEDDEVQRLRMERNHADADRRLSLQELIRAQEVVGGTCPNCRYTMDLDQAAAKGQSTKTYNGDRILVAKFPYDFADPRRWDVVVFRYPGDAKMNYIKRLVGLPHETIKIFHGDVHAKPPNGQFEIARKPAEKVLAMAQTVYDNDYPAPELAKAGWPARWQPVGAAGAREWDSSDEGRTFSFNGGADEAWLRYQHFVPFEADWQQIERDGRVSAPPLPHLITDFYAYNTHELRGSSSEGPGLGWHWVSDLILEATVDVQGDQGAIVFDLVKGGRHLNCAFDVATGQAKLEIDGENDFHPTAQTSLRGAGKHHVTFANVDRQLRVWIDGNEVVFSPDGTYPDLKNSLPTRDDLSPAGIAVRGVKATVSHLVLKRDLYYIAERGDAAGRLSDYDNLDGSWTRKRFADFFADPAEWTADSLFGQRRSVEFPLKADQFFVLGDNSPASKDSRLWSEGGPEYYVSRELLIGKALYIYWPHSLDKIPYVNIPLPFFPNVSDMGFVR